MAIDYLQCVCNHRKFRHYQGTTLCDDCDCREFSTDTSVTHADTLEPGDMCVVKEPLDDPEYVKARRGGTSDTSHNEEVRETAADYRGAADSGLKDSGQRLQFESGMVRDVEDNKPGFHFMIPKDVPLEYQMLTRVAEHLRKGAKKYTPRNWEKGDSNTEAERARESAFRHMFQWITGETDEDHAAAVITNIIFAETMQYKANKKKEV